MQIASETKTVGLTAGLTGFEIEPEACKGLHDRPMKARQGGRAAASHIEAGKGYWWHNWNLWRTVPYQ
jgi:hypothetical protein